MQNRLFASAMILLAAVAPLYAADPSSKQKVRGKPVASPQSEAYRLVVLFAKPVGYWRLGEADGATVAVDETTNKHDGKFVGQPKFGVVGAIKDDANSAVSFDGQSCIEIPDDPVFSQPTSGAGLTVEVWMRPDKLDFAEDGTFKYIHWLGKGEAEQQEWGFRFYSKGDAERSNRISAYIWNSEGKLGAGAYFQDPITVGEWLHIVACFQPGDASETRQPPGVQIYKNGVFRKGPPEKGTLYNNPPEWSITPVHGTAAVRLGTRDGKSFLIGGLDEAAIYPRVLTAEEVRLHYEVGTGKRKLLPIEIAKLKRAVKPAP